MSANASLPPPAPSFSSDALEIITLTYVPLDPHAALEVLTPDQKRPLLSRIDDCLKGLTALVAVLLEPRPDRKQFAAARRRLFRDYLALKQLVGELGTPPALAVVLHARDDQDEARQRGSCPQRSALPLRQACPKLQQHRRTVRRLLG